MGKEFAVQDVIDAIEYINVKSLAHNEAFNAGAQGGMVGEDCLPSEKAANVLGRLSVSDEETKRKIIKNNPQIANGFAEESQNRLRLSVEENQNRVTYTIVEREKAPEASQDDINILWSFAKGKINFRNITDEAIKYNFISRLSLLFITGNQNTGFNTASMENIKSIISNSVGKNLSEKDVLWLKFALDYRLRIQKLAKEASVNLVKRGGLKPGFRISDKYLARIELQTEDLLNEENSILTMNHVLDLLALKNIHEFLSNSHFKEEDIKI